MGYTVFPCKAAKAFGPIPFGQLDMEGIKKFASPRRHNGEIARGRYGKDVNEKVAGATPKGNDIRCAIHCLPCGGPLSGKA